MCSLWDICRVTAESSITSIHAVWKLLFLGISYYTASQPQDVRSQEGFMSVSCGGVRAAMLQLGNRALLQFDTTPTIQAATS